MVIAFFFALKDKLHPSLPSISLKIIQLTVSLFIDSNLHCFWFINNYVFLLTLLLPIYFLIFLYLLSFVLYFLLLPCYLYFIKHVSFFYYCMLIFHLFYSISNSLSHLILNLPIFNFKLPNVVSFTEILCQWCFDKHVFCVEKK